MSHSFFTMQQLFEAGVHFGHKKNFWNPKMAPYIYGVRGGIHIIDLQKTYSMLNTALAVLKTVAAKNGKILFVGTKKQASDIIAEGAAGCGQHYVNRRWMGGTLTNWATVSRSLKTLSDHEKQLANADSLMTKKERLNLTRKQESLEGTLGGIRVMGGLPDMLFVIDTYEQRTAIKEANKLKIPVVAVVDTNTSLDGIAYVIPGNDDSSKAIQLYVLLAQQAILEGIQTSLVNAGVDVGAVADHNLQRE